MSKKLIIIIVIGIIFLGFVWAATRDSATDDPVSGKPLPEKEFYTREDLKYIEPQPGTVNIYYMWMKGCPTCAALDRWFAEMKEVHSIKVYKFNIARESALFSDMLEAYNVPAEKRGFVPAIFVSNRYFIGFDPEAMENLIKDCLAAGDCVNPYDKLK